MSPRSGIPFGDQQPRVAEDVGDLAAVTADDRDARGHGFDEHPAKLFAPAARRQARRAQNVHRVEPLRNLAVRNPRHDLNAVGERCCKGMEIPFEGPGESGGLFGPNPVDGDPRTAPSLATSRRTPARAVRSRSSRGSRARVGIAARVGAELLGGARPGDAGRAGEQPSPRRCPAARCSWRMQDHNRSVFTVVACEGRPGGGVARRNCLRTGTDRSAGGTKEHIRGSAPPMSCLWSRSVPVTWIEPEEVAAQGLAERIGDELALPVFLYGELASGLGPAYFGPAASMGWRRRVESGALTPDFGPGSGRRAGWARCWSGRRRPLIALNVNLRGELVAARGRSPRSSASVTAAFRACELSASRCGERGSCR